MKTKLWQLLSSTFHNRTPMYNLTQILFVLYRDDGVALDPNHYLVANLGKFADFNFMEDFRKHFSKW